MVDTICHEYFRRSHRLLRRLFDLRSRFWKLVSEMLSLQKQFHQAGAADYSFSLSLTDLAREVKTTGRGSYSTTIAGGETESLLESMPTLLQHYMLMYRAHGKCRCLVGL